MEIEADLNLSGINEKPTKLGITEQIRTIN